MLRIDKSCYCRFVFCAQVRKNVFHKWEKKCEYIEFSDKAKIKECADASMVLMSRPMARLGP